MTIIQSFDIIDLSKGEKEMQVVIDIPEEIYERAKVNIMETMDFRTVREAIFNGTPLPKGHGRLGDLDAIWDKLKELEEYYKAEFLKESNVIHESAMNGRLYGFTNSKFIVQDAPTIIKTDNAESEYKE